METLIVKQKLEVIMNMEKVFKVSQIRDLFNQVLNEKISFSRFVEILNENANKKTFDINIVESKSNIDTLIEWMEGEKLKQENSICASINGTLNEVITKAKEITNYK
jgi:hypothetical protein